MNNALTSKELQPLRQLAVAIKQEWFSGDQTPDARAAFATYPELLSVKSIFLDLSYEEFCLRHQRGEALDPEQYCARFPRYQQALHQLVAAHLYLAANPGMVPEDPPEVWPGPGEQVAGCTILRELGRGAFARVYLATEAATGDRPVALKLTLEGGVEACILGQLPHPNIVHINSAGEDEQTGLTRLCMPYLGAATLHDLLHGAFPKPGSPPPTRAKLILEVLETSGEPGDPPPHVEPGSATPAEILVHGTYPQGIAELGRQIAGALAFVHEVGVSHRDLKPSNVLLGPGGRPVLLDFNLSSDGRFAAPRLGGTLPYMAPEQIQALLAGKIVSPELDGRADLFSLGVILYELLTGQYPFGPLSPQTAIEQSGPALLDRQRRGFTPIHPFNPAVDSALARIVEGCLAFDAADRPASAAALAEELNRFLALSQQRPPARARSRRPLIGVAILLLSAFLAAGTWIIPPSAAAPNPQEVLLADGRKHMAAKEWPKAILCFQEADSEERPNGLARACAAYCMAYRGHHELALKYCELALKAKFDTPAIRNNAGVALAQLGRIDEAYDAYSEAINQDAGLREAHYNRALLFLRINNPKPNQVADALPDIIQVIDPQAPNPLLLFVAAQIACRVPDRPKAAQYLRDAVHHGIPHDHVESAKREFRWLVEFNELLKVAKGNEVIPPTLPNLVDPSRALSN